MLIATLIALLFMGSGANFMLDAIDQMEDNLKSERGDDIERNVRLNAALYVVNRMEDTAKGYAKTDAGQEKALIKLIQKYDTASADIKNNMGASSQSRVEYQQHILVLRTELKNKLGREDWSTMFSDSENE